jgi:uncharacterized protein YwqG
MGFFNNLFGKKKQPEITVTPKASTEIDLELIEIFPGLTLPKVLAAHKDEITKTKESFVAIKATPTNDLSLEESKFGYYPFMPLDAEYPKDKEGKYMYPLAQINCKDMPALNDYPTSGYLQFYISGFDDMMGVDFDNLQAQTNFRVLYFEETDITEYKADFSFLDDVMASDMLPVYKPHGLTFELKEEYLGIQDARYLASENSIIKYIEQYPDYDDELYEPIYDNYGNNGHKIGGYAYFTQEDPRLYNEELKDFILLLQIDTDEEIMWGDSGVGNFFIHKNDLANKDFSKVMFTWDCC